MLLLIWLVVFAVVVAFLLLVPASWRRALTERYAGGRPVACPKDQREAVVHIDVGHAAASVMHGSPDLRLADCTCWPERAGCGQECLTQAVHAEPYKEVEVKRGRKQIYHLPVLLAAFAAWYVGMVWHSQVMFRARWLHAIGITQAEVKQIVWWLSPHLLTAAVCLLFAYGVAWLLAVSHRKGVLEGMLMSAALCGAILVASWFAIYRMPHELFAIEAGYVGLATLTIGAIVGGLSRRLLLRAQ